MGSKVSIYNDTEVTLNIALSQVGPLYYQNFVRPGECFTADVGKVWFTIDGRVWNGENDYEGIDVAQSIIDCTLQAVQLFMILFKQHFALEAVGKAITTFDKKSTEVRSEVIEAHGSDNTRKLLMRLFDGSAIHSPGWYFGDDKRISISGGPKYVRVDDEEVSHKIDLDTINNTFLIKEKI